MAWVTVPAEQFSYPYKAPAHVDYYTHGDGQVRMQYKEESATLYSITVRFYFEFADSHVSLSKRPGPYYLLLNYTSGLWFRRSSDASMGNRPNLYARLRTADPGEVPNNYDGWTEITLYKNWFGNNIGYGRYKHEDFAKYFYFPPSYLCVDNRRIGEYDEDFAATLTTSAEVCKEFSDAIMKGNPSDRDRITLGDKRDLSLYPDKTVAIPLTETYPRPKWFCYFTDLGNNKFRVNASMGRHEECKNNKFYDGKVTLTIIEPTDILNNNQNTAKPKFSAFDFKFSSKTYTNYGTYQLGSMYQQTDTQHIIDLNTMPGSAEVTYTMKTDKVNAYRRSWFKIKAVLTLTDIYGYEYTITDAHPDATLELQKSIFIHKAPDQIPGTPYLDMNSLEHKSRVTLKENHWTFRWTLPDDYDQAADRYITANGGRVMGLKARLFRTDNKGKISTVPIVDPNKVAAGKKGASAYYNGVVANGTNIGNVYINHNDTAQVYVYRNDYILLPADTTSIDISPASVDSATGFAVGDKVSFQISTYSTYGVNFENTGVEDALVSAVRTSEKKDIQNAAVVQARNDNTWKEGIVQVYQNNEWVEAEAVYVYTAEGEWVEST